MTEQNTRADEEKRSHHLEDEINLGELLLVIWSGKWIISAVTGLAAVISVTVALTLPNIYTANTLLAPAESGGGGLPGLMKQYGSLASLAGVSIPGDEQSSRAQLGMQLLKSRAFIGEFVSQREILPELMAVERWDSTSGELVFNSDVYDVKTQEWIRSDKTVGSPKPSAQKAYRAFMSVLRVSQDKLTGYVSVSIEHQSPEVAARWVNWLVEDVNVAVKSQDVAEAKRSIEYLKQQVANTSLSDLKAMFFELIQSQTETIMLAEVRPEYVFKTIDPAVIPEEKSAPNRALFCVVWTLVGGMLGLLLVLGRYFLRSQATAFPDP